MVNHAAACVQPGGAETSFIACQLNVVSISMCGVLHWLTGMLAAEVIPYYGQDSGKTGLNSGSLMLHVDRLWQSNFSPERDAIHQGVWAAP